FRAAQTLPLRLRSTILVLNSESATWPDEKGSEMGTTKKSWVGYGRLIQVCAVLLAMAIGSTQRSADAATVLIDDFTLPDPGDTVIVGVPLVQVAETGLGILGGEREISVEIIGTPNPNSAIFMVGRDSDHMEDAFQLATVGLSPAVATILYDGVGSAGLGGIDLTGGGSNNRFLLQFISNDALPTAGLDIEVTVTSASGSSTATVIAPNSMSAFDV